jgi:hypothetical protein
MRSWSKSSTLETSPQADTAMKRVRERPTEITPSYNRNSEQCSLYPKSHLLHLF